MSASALSCNTVLLQVLEDERHFINPDTFSLEVVNTSVSEDAGFYTCVAWSDIGSDQHTVLVQITDVTCKIFSCSVVHTHDIRLSNLEKSLRAISINI